MSPNPIESKIFIQCKELTKDTLDKLGPVTIRESLTNTWGYDTGDNVAVPTIVVAGDGRIGRVKWTIRQMVKFRLLIHFWIWLLK